MNWFPATDARVSLLAIIGDLDGLEERCSDLTPGGEPDSVHGLSFEKTEEALHRGIVEAMTFAAHGGLDVVEPEQLAIVAAGVSPTGIKVVDQSLGGRRFRIAMVQNASTHSSSCGNADEPGGVFRRVDGDEREFRPHVFVAH